MKETLKKKKRKKGIKEMEENKIEEKKYQI